MSSRAVAAPVAAYVLHRYDWSESSLIVELFTRDLGRVVVAAKGAKRPTSQLRAVLRPFQRLSATLGRTVQGAEVHNLRGAEWAGGVPMAGGDALFSAFYLNELLMKLLAREDPHPALWDAYAATLTQLGNADEPAALRAFELWLLREIGWLPRPGPCDGDPVACAAVCGLCPAARQRRHDGTGRRPLCSHRA